jgi:hypothetical protein
MSDYRKEALEIWLRNWEKTDEYKAMVKEVKTYFVLPQKDEIPFFTCPSLPSQETVAKKLSGYDDATWSRMKEDRKRTYRRAADMLICQWKEFVVLFESTEKGGEEKSAQAQVKVLDR